MARKTKEVTIEVMPKKEKMKHRQVFIIGDDLDRRLRGFTQANRISVSELVRSLLEQVLDEEPAT